MEDIFEFLEHALGVVRKRADALKESIVNVGAVHAHADLLVDEPSSRGAAE